MRLVISLLVLALGFVGPAMAEDECDDPFAQLRCTGAAPCPCADKPAPPGPCTNPQTAEQNWTCLSTQLQALNQLCLTSNAKVTHDKRMLARWHEVWRYANDHDFANRIQIPPNCQ
jgi:hypothetical protein